MTLVAEEGDWIGTPPADAVPFSTQNLPAPDVPNYEDEYYFEIISYAGGATKAITLPWDTADVHDTMVRFKNTSDIGGWVCSGFCSWIKTNSME